MRPTEQYDTEEYYKHIIIYVDDILAIRYGQRLNNEQYAQGLNPKRIRQIANRYIYALS